MEAGSASWAKIVLEALRLSCYESPDSRPYPDHPDGRFFCSLNPERRVKHSAARQLFSWLLMLMLSACLSGQAAAASNAPVSELFLLKPQILATEHSVFFSYGLRVRGLMPIRDQLRDGAQMVLEGSASLLQRNLLRPNSLLATQPLSWHLRHDPLTREFIITDQAGAVRGGPFIDALLRDSLSELSLELNPEEALEPDQTYILEFSLILRYDQAPPWLRNALFFWSRDLSPTLNYEQRFTLE